MATNSYSNLKSAKSAWNKALRNFGIVTVMNAKIYDIYDGLTIAEFGKYIVGDSGALTEGQKSILRQINENWFSDGVIDLQAKIDFKDLKANEIIALYLMTNPIAELKYLKTANSTQEGPTKTITGGQNASPLIKYGKTARLEMQDALGNAEALEALSGLTVEYFRTTYANSVSEIMNDNASDVLHATTLFAGHKAIVGDTFVIDARTGAQVPAYVIFYDFLPDSLFNLNQDAEGDATVFDMNGDLIETKIYVGDLSKPSPLDEPFKVEVFTYSKDPRVHMDATLTNSTMNYASSGTVGTVWSQPIPIIDPEDEDYNNPVTKTVTTKVVNPIPGGDEDGIVVGAFYTILPQLDYASNPQVIEGE